MFSAILSANMKFPVFLFARGVSPLSASQLVLAVYRGKRQKRENTGRRAKVKTRAKRVFLYQAHIGP